MSDLIIIQEQRTLIEIQEQPVAIISVGTQGPQGIQGPAGSGGGSSSATAGATIFSGRAVVIIDDLMYPADPTNTTHGAAVVGIANQSGIAGATLTYIGAGLISGLSSYTANLRYFIGLSGVLSTAAEAPGAVWTKLMGFSQTTTDFLVNMETTYYI